MMRNSISVPGWLALVLGAAGPIVAALIGMYQANQVEQIRAQASGAQIQSQKLQHDQDVQLQTQQFDADQQTKREANYARYIPMLLSDDQHAQDEAVAVLLVLYPNTANDVFSIVHDRFAQHQGGQPVASASPTPTASAPQSRPTPGGGVTPQPGQTATPTPLPTPQPAATVVARPDTLSTALEQAQTVKASTGTWLIVVGSDETLDAAKDEVNHAGDFGGVRVYKRGPYFATTVGDFPTKEQAQSALISVRAKVRASAFVVNFNDWCGTPTPADGYAQCANG